MGGYGRSRHYHLAPDGEDSDKPVMQGIYGSPETVPWLNDH